ncbi:MAG: hypothetical protein BWX75_01395 [Candidatus Cloacimonetes bacterium ADurb.Bin088]|nr:MAG: hypothetical protein BWX75_01395 [Candidatus Cloacimonetes bacterium ADurb.Bin088]
MQYDWGFGVSSDHKNMGVQSREQRMVGSSAGLVSSVEVVTDGISGRES